MLTWVESIIPNYCQIAC